MPNDLISVLDEMRDAVVGGDYPRLTQLLPVLSEAEGTLRPMPMAELAALRMAAAQNAACLDAAISGLKSAQLRLRDIAKAEAGLTTYDREGVMATLSTALPKSRRV